MIGTIIGAIAVGAIVGALARLVLPGRQSVSMVMTILLGIVGSFLGSWATAQFGYHNANGGFAILPFLVGIAAAAVLIGIYLAAIGRHDTTLHR